MAGSCEACSDETQYFTDYEDAYDYAYDAY